MTAKVIGINGRSPSGTNKPPETWHLQQCDDCDSFHFKWWCLGEDMMQWSLVCAGCESQYRFAVEASKDDSE